VRLGSNLYRGTVGLYGPFGDVGSKNHCSWYCLTAIQVSSLFELLPGSRLVDVGKPFKGHEYNLIIHDLQRRRAMGRPLRLERDYNAVLWVGV
jgi:hypothetical protein